MPVDRDEFSVADLVQVRVVWDPVISPPDPLLQSYNGALVGVPPTYIPLPGIGEASTLFGVRGFGRQDPGGTWEWVIIGDAAPLVDQFVNSLTGKGGWTNSSARTTVKLMVERLYSAGIPTDTIASQIPLFVQAIAAEVVAEQQAGVFGTSGRTVHADDGPAEPTEGSPT